MLINLSTLSGLPAVDVSQGVKVGEVRSLSFTLDGDIDGLLVKRHKGEVVLVEPPCVLGIGSAAAVIDFDEEATVMSSDQVENNMVIDRPVITLSGNPAGILEDCSINVEAMEIREIFLKDPDRATSLKLPASQVRTLGLQYIILKNDPDAEKIQQKKDLPVSRRELAKGPENKRIPEPPSVPVPDRSRPVLPPVGNLEPEPELSFLILDRKLGSQIDRLAKQEAPEIRHVTRLVEPLEVKIATESIPLKGEWEALVNKKLVRTLSVEGGGMNKTLTKGTLITKEIAEDLAGNHPFSLAVLSLLVK